MVLLELFISFLKIGFTSFGGVSMVPLINSEMLSHGWMNAQEVSDIVAIAEMTPGPLGMNSSTFAGIRVAGIPGAIIAMLGILFPTLTIGFAAVVFFQKFRKSSIMKKMLMEFARRASDWSLRPCLRWGSAIICRIAHLTRSA